MPVSFNWEPSWPTHDAERPKFFKQPYVWLLMMMIIIIADHHHHHFSGFIFPGMCYRQNNANNIQIANNAEWASYSIGHKQIILGYQCFKKTNNTWISMLFSRQMFIKNKTIKHLKMFVWTHLEIYNLIIYNSIIFQDALVWEVTI